MASEKEPKGYSACPHCERRLFLKIACRDNPADIARVTRMFAKSGITDEQLRKLIWVKGLRFKANGSEELKVTGREDTWLIKGFEGQQLSLWHNNYNRISDTERVITSGFHRQRTDGHKLKELLGYTAAYTFQRHLDVEKAKNAAELPVMTEMTESQPVTEVVTTMKWYEKGFVACLKNRIRRIVAALRRAEKA